MSGLKSTPESKKSDSGDSHRQPYLQYACGGLVNRLWFPILPSGTKNRNIETVANFLCEYSSLNVDLAEVFR